jgi:alginate O-acetyltransferase complex protein AlgI
MLFNSFGFLLLFLPIVAAIFFLLARIDHWWAAAWLALASLFFYGWWDIRYVPLLLLSVCFNYWAGSRIGNAVAPFRKRWLAFAVVANLLLLGYFKYADFAVSSVNFITHADYPVLKIVLPIGISFFTFTQIAFLVDTFRGEVREYRFVHYLLFVTYFPHLIAGPILHHKEMMPQFADSRTYRFSAINWADGLSIFIIGLAKKVLIADNLADYATVVFDKTDAPSLFIAWGGVLAYAFQLYFDFSGYSDMAIGLSRLFGIKLPLNFHSPYKAANIIVFWRHWHMTLSRFLRDYLYIPLGGGRKGTARRYVNLMLTMLLGGLWHGAGWNFVIWGALHGAYLMVNHSWAGLLARYRLPAFLRFGKVSGTLLTFFAVCIAWVFFRATDLARAVDILKGLLFFSGVGIPDSIGEHLGNLRPLLEQYGVSFYLGGGARFVQTYLWVGFAAVLAFGFPNTQQIMSRYAPALDGGAMQGFLAAGANQLRWMWMPSVFWAILIGLIATASLLSLNRPAAFLYFQF